MSKVNLQGWGHIVAASWTRSPL